MALANKAQEAMNEKPNDGKEEGDKAGSDLSDSDQEGKQNNALAPCYPAVAGQFLRG